MSQPLQYGEPLSTPDYMKVPPPQSLNSNQTSLLTSCNTLVQKIAEGAFEWYIVQKILDKAEKEKKQADNDEKEHNEELELARKSWLPAWGVDPEDLDKKGEQLRTAKGRADVKYNDAKNRQEELTKNLKDTRKLLQKNARPGPDTQEARNFIKQATVQLAQKLSAREATCAENLGRLWFRTPSMVLDASLHEDLKGTSSLDQGSSSVPISPSGKSTPKALSSGQASGFQTPTTARTPREKDVAMDFQHVRDRFDAYRAELEGEPVVLKGSYDWSLGDWFELVDWLCQEARVQNGQAVKDLLTVLLLCGDGEDGDDMPELNDLNKADEGQENPSIEPPPATPALPSAEPVPPTIKRKGSVQELATPGGGSTEAGRKSSESKWPPGLVKNGVPELPSAVREHLLQAVQATWDFVRERDNRTILETNGKRTLFLTAYWNKKFMLPEAEPEPQKAEPKTGSEEGTGSHTTQKAQDDDEEWWTKTHAWWEEKLQEDDCRAYAYLMLETGRKHGKSVALKNGGVWDHFKEKETSGNEKRGIDGRAGRWKQFLEEKFLAVIERNCAKVNGDDPNAHVGEQVFQVMLYICTKHTTRLRLQELLLYGHRNLPPDIFQPSHWFVRRRAAAKVCSMVGDNQMARKTLWDCLIKDQHWMVREQAACEACRLLAVDPDPAEARPLLDAIIKVLFEGLDANDEFTGTHQPTLRASVLDVLLQQLPKFTHKLRMEIEQRADFSAKRAKTQVQQAADHIAEQVKKCASQSDARSRYSGQQTLSHIRQQIKKQMDNQRT